MKPNETPCLAAKPLSARAVNKLPNYDAIATRGDCVWNGRAAHHALTFIQSLCKYTEGRWAGQPFVLLPWQRNFVANLYGWLRPDGTRRYRQAHLLIPRKSGKTELAAALALYHLLADDEPTPTVVGIARDRTQAKLCLSRAFRMAAQEPRLKKMTEQYQMALTAPSINGSYKILSQDAPSAHGLHVSACIADEIHAMENRRELWEAVMTAMGARSQPLMLSITTAGVLRESLEYDLFDYSKKVCAGTIENPSFLPCLYYAEQEANWQSPTVWKQANPSLGIITSREWYTQECQRAQDQVSYETPFRTYYLCQHITVQSRWLRMSDWDGCASPTPFDEAELQRLPCYLGIDLAQTTDLTAICAVWSDGKKTFVRSWCFAPEVGAIERSRIDSVPYLQWAAQGALTLTNGDVTDYAAVKGKVQELCKTYRVRLVGYDPYNAQNLGNDLDAAGIKVVRVPQSFANLGTATRQFENAVIGKTLLHEQNPVLSWAVSNVCIDTDHNGNPRPSKKRSVERIDPVVAAIIGIAASNHDQVQTSVYEHRGLVWL